LSPQSGEYCLPRTWTAGRDKAGALSYGNMAVTEKTRATGAFFPETASAFRREAVSESDKGCILPPGILACAARELA